MLVTFSSYKVAEQVHESANSRLPGTSDRGQPSRYPQNHQGKLSVTGKNSLVQAGVSNYPKP